MKILGILTGAMIYDGITNSVYNYYAAMDRSDMQIDMVSSREHLPEMKQKFEALGCTVHCLEFRDSNPIKYFCKLAALIGREKYDVVHAHGNSATLAIETTAAWIAGCKVRIIHSRNSSCEHQKADKMLRPLMYATYTDGFACGDKAGKWLLGDRDFTVIQNGKDIDRFLYRPEVREEYRAKLGAAPGNILVGHVGLFHKQKNHEFLIDIFQALHSRSDKYRLVLIGEGENQEMIHQKVVQLGLADSVLFLGRQSNVEDWLQAMDIMVFPSWFEGMPNVVLEWQISGLPVLLSDRITRECKIMDNVVYLPLEQSAEQWADQVEAMPAPDRNATRDAVREAFAAAGFDIRINAVELKKKYAELIDKRGK